MQVSSQVRLPAGTQMTSADVALLELDISARMSIRMEAYMREEQLRLEREMLHGTSTMKSPLGLLRPTVRAC